MNQFLKIYESNKLFIDSIKAQRISEKWIERCPKTYQKRRNWVCMKKSSSLFTDFS